VGATLHSSLVSQIVQYLPRPLLSVLDAWSRRVARRRAALRQQKWLRRKAAMAADAPATGTSPSAYHLKPWRD
jgi:hypothetical protein